MKLRTTNHTVYLIAYHLVWVTKYRRTALNAETWTPLKTILRGVAAESCPLRRRAALEGRVVAGDVPKFPAPQDAALGRASVASG
jgi:hypothetical protein